MFLPFKFRMPSTIVSTRICEGPFTSCLVIFLVFSTTTLAGLAFAVLGTGFPLTAFTVLETCFPLTALTGFFTLFVTGDFLGELFLTAAFFTVFFSFFSIHFRISVFYHFFWVDTTRTFH